MAVILVAGASGRGGDEAPNCTIFLHDIGTLQAGVVTEVRVPFGPSAGELKGRTACPLLFSKGHEVKTSLSRASDAFLAKLELLQHRQILAAYLEKNKGEDCRMQPYIQSTFELPEGTVVDLLPQKVDVSFTVSAQGLVEGVTVGGQLPEPVGRVIRQSIESWLFLPRLDKGTPKPSVVRVPIQLK